MLFKPLLIRQKNLHYNKPCHLKINFVRSFDDRKGSSSFEKRVSTSDASNTTQI